MSFYSSTLPLSANCTMYLQADGMILVNTFEDTFGDKYGGGVWCELSEIVSSNIFRNVVALASLYGDFTIMCYFTVSYLYLLITN